MSKTSGLLRVIFPDAPGDWHLQYTQTFHYLKRIASHHTKVLTANIFSLYTDGLEVGIKDLKRRMKSLLHMYNEKPFLLIFNLTSTFQPLWFGSRPLSSVLFYFSQISIITTLSVLPC